MKKVLLSNFGIYPEKKLIIEVHTGTAAQGSIMNFKNIEIKDQKFSKDYDIITDIRDVVISITIDQIKNYVDFLVNGKMQNPNAKSAYVISSLNQSLYTNKFVAHEKELNYPIGIFKSLDEAKTWINQTLDVDFINSEIKKLKAKSKIKFEIKNEY